MWQFEFKTEGNTKSVSSSMAHDGSTVWVACSTGIDIFKYFGQDSSHYVVESEYYPNIEVENNLTLERLPNWEFENTHTIEISGISSNIVKHNDYMYVFTDCRLAKINSTTREIEYFRLPSKLSVKSILTANNKIWLCITDVKTDKDSLISFNPSDSTWGNIIEIPGVVQKNNRVMAWGGNSFICVLGYNDNSVHKFNSTTGQYITSTIVNRRPSSIHYNQNKEMLIGSANGMISSYNPDTDTSTNVHGILDQADGLVDDGTYIWSISPYLSRLHRVDTVDNFRLQTLGKIDPNSPPDEPIPYIGTESFALEGYGDNTFKQILITPEYTFEKWNGVDFDIVQVKQHIFTLTDSQLQCIRNVALFREAFVQVRLTGMVAVGETSYYGETT